MARGIMRDLSQHLSSVGTRRNFEQSLKNVGRVIAAQGKSLRELRVEEAVKYLEDRKGQVAQSQLNMERQALQAMFQHVTHQLAPNERLSVIKSSKKTKQTSRAYTFDQVLMIAEHQSPKNALATRVAYYAGLRAHELLTLDYPDNQPPSERDSKDQMQLRKLKFAGRKGRVYTVVGKGGLCREVSLPIGLAEELERSRRKMPLAIRDRGVNYQTLYDVGGGNSWSKSFTEASQRALGWSAGAHGLRHTYTQERLRELFESAAVAKRFDELVTEENQKRPDDDPLTLVEKESLKTSIAFSIASQELGHFRPSITLVYTR